MNEVKTTWFYIPNSCISFQLSKVKVLISSVIPSSKDWILESEYDNVKIGLSDGNKRDLSINN